MMRFLDGRALFFLVVAAATAGAATTEHCGRSVTNRMGPMRAREHARERAREREIVRASERVSQIFIERESEERESAASKNALEANGEEKIGAAQNNGVLDATDLPAIVTQVAGIPFWMPSTSSHHANLCEPPAALHADTATISRTTKRGAATSTHEQQAFSIWQALWSPHHISRDTLSCQVAVDGAGAGGVGGDGAARCGGGRQGYARGADFTDVVLAPGDLMPLGALTRARVFCALVAASRHVTGAYGAVVKKLKSIMYANAPDAGKLARFACICAAQNGSMLTQGIVWVCGLTVMACVVDAIERLALDQGAQGGS